MTSSSRATAPYGGRRRFTGRINRIVKKVVKGAKRRWMVGPAAAALHPRHRKRMRTAGSVSSVKSKTYRDPNQYRQMETLVTKRGRRMTRTRFQNSLVRASYNFTKYVMRAYNPDDDGGSVDGGLRQPLGFETVGSLMYLPVLCMNLTSIPQATNTSSRFVNAYWRLTQDNTTGAIGFQTLSTMTNTGASFTQLGWGQYVGLGVSATAQGISTTRRALMEYINMRYRIRAPVQRPTRVVVQIVQPYGWFQGMPEELALTGGSISNEHYQPWINIAARNTKSPVQNIPWNSAKKPWRVIAAKVYELQPTSTTEGDANGHDVVEKWFWKCNRMVNYDEQPFSNADNNNATDSIIGDARIPETNTSNYVAKGKALYMIVQAYAPNSTAAFDNNVHPSFEFNFEKKLSSLTGQIMN